VVVGGAPDDAREAIWSADAAALLARSAALAAAVTLSAIAIAVPIAVADRPHRPARPAGVGGALLAAARHPELHRRVPDGLRARPSGLAQDVLGVDRCRRSTASPARGSC
jgi:hypothetical protein